MGIINSGFTPYQLPVLPQYKAIRNQIVSHQSDWLAYNRAYLQNDLALQLTAVVEADMARIQRDQAIIKHQLAQIQARLHMVG